MPGELLATEALAKPGPDLALAGEFLASEPFTESGPELTLAAEFLTSEPLSSELALTGGLAVVAVTTAKPELPEATAV